MTVLRLFHSASRSADSDADLLARFVASRDESAFAELLTRHGPLVYRVCRRLVDAALADDAFQATFLVLASRAGRVRKAASVGSWLIGVAGRVARQVGRQSVLARLEEPLAERAEHFKPVETADLGRVLDEELTRLPEKLRAVVVACLIEERTQADAAKVLGESERTIRRRVSEARQLLRERLERRGVVPAVAGGLLAGLGGTAAAVPLRLADSTLTVVFDFLADGAAVASAPAVLAKGVAMSGMRKTLAACVALAALGLSALGVGLAEDKPKPPESNTIPPQSVPLGDGRPAEPPKPVLTGPPLFIVTGADDLANRVVQREAEYAARKFAVRWTGKPLTTPKEPWKITIKLDAGRTAGATTFTFESEPKCGVKSAEMQLTGSLEHILRNVLPHEVTHCVLAVRFGRPVPRWVDEGISVLSESLKEQADHDRRLREYANAGRLIQLKHLLPMKEYPKDMVVLFAQGHSVARFLHERDGSKLLPLVDASFADGWDQALKATYGFKDADALEEAWLAWLRKPDSVLKAEAKVVKPSRTEYVIEPPDILRIEAGLRDKPGSDLRPLPLQSVKGEHLVRPDGTVNLGVYGSASVAGLTLTEAATAILKQVRSNGEPNAVVTVDVTAFNSKAYYVITDFAGKGEQVQWFPLTGNETVLDAIAAVGGVKPDGKRHVWIEQKNGDQEVLPVDWAGITEKGLTRTNYQLLPDDRVYIRAKE